MQYIATYNSTLPLWQSWVHHITARRLFFLLVSVLALLAFSYLYLINATVYKVVQYGKIQNQNAALTLNVDSLQSTYIAQKNAISLTLAYSDGYQNIASPQFISAASIPTASFALKYP